ncbi:hypothetical protein BAY61_00120 [Prauserella marina]|uniref:Uncharacterized protein n=1 Tax=Prauserella marina TaxID=530584 RepID=A0A222VID6_9PSEU|nr:hypothetical protein [Prauserella marina]ASR33654.1 hypothetical protein BAY61_00120 [Prauserella marina]PWV82199.1 hypothetical protein DES30_102437 [Prauserella marina]SDD21449.1 hypothetical protein SAMN05421630_106437 [Prauserella marina]
MDSGTWIVGAILATEIAFWVLLLLGLCARYLLKLRRVSTFLLVSVPVVDLVLILLVAFDLSRGATPTTVHGLAAVYLGFSVGFGHYVITRADAWFAHRFAGAPRPVRPPRTGPAKVRHEWRSWFRVVVACAIAVPAMLLMKLISGWDVPGSLDELWEDELWSWAARLILINIAWLLTGPVYATFFKATKEDAAAMSRRVR